MNSMIIYRALDILGNECDFIQSEVCKNSRLICGHNDKILYYGYSNYYFEIGQEEGCKKYGKSKEHRPNPIIQMGLFMDGDGMPLAFSLFPGNTNEQKSLKPLEKKVLSEFCCQKFIYCSDAGLASEDIRVYNHMGERAFIVTQSIKKLPAEDKAWALTEPLPAKAGRFTSLLKQPKVVYILRHLSSFHSYPISKLSDLFFSCKS